MNSRFYKPCLIQTLLALSTLWLTPSVASTNNSLLPWDPRTIKAHIEQQDFIGRLSTEQLTALVEHGNRLFMARFTLADGVGRPMSTQAIIPTKRKRPARRQFSRTAGLDANACSSCHNLPMPGGAGDFSVNVFVSEGFQNTDFDNVDPQFSNERNTNHLFGAGLIELLAREMTADLQRQRTHALQEARNSGNNVTARLQSKGVEFGYLLARPDGTVDPAKIQGVDHDLTIRPFSQKGVINSLRQFTINALNHHHGILADERYGARWTGETDFDEDGHLIEATEGDISALVAWQATRPPPARLEVTDRQWQQASMEGERLFHETGCTHCHRPYLPLRSLEFADPGPIDFAGTRRLLEDDDGAIYDLGLYRWAKNLPRSKNGDILVPLFGDLKRHKIADLEVAHLGNELLAQRFVERDVFMTAELWGIASTDPYGHRGDLSTLHEVIAVHGGDAREVRDHYMNLDDTEQQYIIAFLSTLIIDEKQIAIESTMLQHTGNDNTQEVPE